MSAIHPNITQSDRDLLASRFRVTDPSNTVPNLSTAKPDPELTPKIVGIYDETPPGGKRANPDAEYLWCSHCQKLTHWKGYVLENGTGSAFMIGRHCGQEHYGANFEFIERDFRDQRNRQQALKSYLTLLSKIGGLEDEISHILACPALKDHDRTVADFRRSAPQTFRALTKAAQSGSLSGVQRVRDYEAEADRNARYKRAIDHYRSLPYEERRRWKAEGLKPERDEANIYSSMIVSFGQMEGSSIIGYYDARRESLKCKEKLEIFRSIEHRGFSGVETARITAATKDLGLAIRSLNKALGEVRLGGRFFGKDHINRLERWSECHRQFSIWSDGENVFAKDRNSSTHKLRHCNFSLLYKTKIIDEYVQD